MSERVTVALRELARRKAEYGSGAEQRKRELLRVLATRRLRRAADIEKLHDVLCFLRAYPDSAELLTLIEQMLAGFAQRSDLRWHSHALIDSGIAGTSIHFSFFCANGELACTKVGAPPRDRLGRFRTVRQARADSNACECKRTQVDIVLIR